jgi:hypothetical protein
MFHGVWDGCNPLIQFDDSVEDIILHDITNSTMVSLKDTFNGVLKNQKYILGKQVCAKKVQGKILVGGCNCLDCVELFDEQADFSFELRKVCGSTQNQGPSCKCFDVSGVIPSEDLVVFQDHKVCTECKYDSHC